jgi:hypothetical protein
MIHLPVAMTGDCARPRKERKEVVSEFLESSTYSSKRHDYSCPLSTYPPPHFFYPIYKKPPHLQKVEKLVCERGKFPFLYSVATE